MYDWGVVLLTELTDKEKCLVIQMMLRMSTQIQKLPQKYKESIQLYIKETSYPKLTPKDISEINLDLDRYLINAETIMQKGLINAIGGKKLGQLAKIFKFGVKAKDGDGGISPALLKEMESKIRSEVDNNDGT